MVKIEIEPSLPPCTQRLDGETYLRFLSEMWPPPSITPSTFIDKNGDEQQAWNYTWTFENDVEQVPRYMSTIHLPKQVAWVVRYVAQGKRYPKPRKRSQRRMAVYQRKQQRVEQGKQGWY